MADGPTIVTKFLADTSRMNDEVDKATSGAGGKFKDFAKGAAIAVGGAFAVDKVIDFGKASVEAAMEDQKAQEILAQTLRNVTGATDAQVASSEEYISNLSKQTAIADDDLRPAMGNLVRGFGDAEEAQKALALATDISAGTGKDMTSVSQALAKAAMGSTGALKKLGIETENADGSAKSMDQIMQDLSKTFGGSAAAAANTAAGKMENAQIQFGEFQEQIGSALLPVLADLGTMFTEKVIPALSAVASWAADNKDVLIAGFIGVAVVVGAVVIPAFISWAVAAGAAAIATLAAISPFILIGALIAAIAFLIIRNWDNIVAGLGVAWEALKALPMKLWEWIQTVFGWIVEGIKLYVSLWVAIFTGAWNLLLAVVTTLWDWIQTVFGWIVAGVQLYVSTLVTVYTTAWNVLLAVVTTLWDWIRTVFGWIVDGIKAYVALWVSIVTGAWNLIRDGATAVWQWIVDKWNAIASAVQTAVNNLLGWVTWGWDQIKNGATAVWSFVTDKFQAIADFFHGLVDKIGATARQIVDAIKGPINSIITLWNNLAFRVPEFTLPEVDLPVVGKVGGQRLGGWTIEFPDLPHLAQGGVLSNPTLFLGGEAGTEIVSPEDLLRTIVAEEGGGNYTLNVYPRTADAADIAYGFRRLELLAGLP